VLTNHTVARSLAFVELNRVLMVPKAIGVWSLVEVGLERTESICHHLHPLVDAS